jgi:hypothetical protein
VSKKYKHECGKQGYGLGMNDVCSACYAYKLRKQGKTEKEIDKAIDKAIANIIY